VRFLSPEAPKYLSPKVASISVPTFNHFAFPPEANLFRMHERSVSVAMQIADEFRPTMVYQRLSLGDWSGVDVAARLGVPLVVEYNGSELWGALNWGTGSVPFAADMLSAEEAMLRRAQLVFSISRPLHEELLNRGIGPRHLAWYPNCVDPVIYDPSRIHSDSRALARKQMGAEDGDFVVAFVGTFGRWHGAEIFAQAAALLCADKKWIERTRIRFAFIGDGKTRNLCSEIIGGSAASNRTVFTGLVPQHEAPRFLSASDGFVASHVPNADGTRFFGSPTKLFEYMAMGKPIVASALDQIAEVLKHDVTALLVPPGNVESLAAGIRALADDRERGLRLGVAARSEVLSKYTWSRHVQVMLDALASSLQEGSA
jgi:glycosyltransferase involved in cell wall biosynthesis